MKIISMDKGSFAFILGLLLWCSHMHANYINTASDIAFWQSAVSGIISDASGPLPGVIVTVKGTQRSAVSDQDGKYSIAAAVGDTLVFSFIGFKETEVSVTSSRIDITMAEDSAQLEEVMINAGYYSVKDKERTGSIARITSKEIETQPVTNILATMQGRMAGVSVTQTTGVPGGGFDIQIRGQNSLRSEGNSPLYVIDGVPYSSETVGNVRSNTILPFTSSPLNSINPGDIESIEVLKDADATAIYGSRGANGVVLVTTKKGKQGPTRYNLSYSHGLGKVTGFMEMMDTGQYVAMREEAFANDGIGFGEADYDVNGVWDRNRYTDWQKELLGGTAEFIDLQGSVSGGSERTQFILNTNLHKETTVFPGDYSYKKGNVRLSLSHSSSDDRFRLNAVAGYTAQKNNQPGVDLTRVALVLAPNAPALYDGQGNLNWEGSTWENPLGALEGKYRSRTGDMIANTMLSYRLFGDVILRSSLGYTETAHQDSRTQPSTMYDPAFMLGSEYSSIVSNSTRRSSWIAEPQVEWSFASGRSKVEALAGATFQELNGRQLVLEGTGFTSNALINNIASARTVAAITDSDYIYKYMAVFGRLNYSWDGRYILNLTGRRDGSSRFGPGKQFANFGAVGAAWLFSREKWFAGQDVLSFGKIRGSYGSAGNDQIGNYQFLNTYASTGIGYGGLVGVAPLRLYNPDFGWETNKKLEAAVEAGFFKDRIFVTAAFYDNRSSNQLVGIPLPATTGFATVQYNLDAVVQNRGVEFTLSTVNFHRDDFRWETHFNISFSKNKLLSFPNLEGSTYRNQLVIGEPLNIKKMYHFTGLNRETGLYEFEDVNGDGQLTAAEDMKTVVDFNPEFFGGVHNTLRYKGWELDFLFQFVKQQNYSEEYNTGLPGMSGNQPASLVHRWQNPGDRGPFQQYSTGVNAGVADAASRYYESDAIVKDASFIRLKNVALYYNVPKEWLGGLQARISVTGQNLLTFTPYKGPDPEFRFTGYLPPLRVFTTGITLTF